MVIYLYKASIYDEDARSNICHQGMTIADCYTDALHNVQDYYVGRTEHLTYIHLEEQNECDCNCFELVDGLYDFIHKHGGLPSGQEEYVK